jgi:penicillin-binding protein 2
VVRREDPRAFVPSRRFIAFGAAILLVFTALTGRLYDLQIVRGGYYHELSEQNRILRLPVTAERGGIVDRKGFVLARNVPGFAVSIIPVDIPRSREQELANRLGVVLGLPSDTVSDAIRAQRLRNPYEPARISKTPVPREIALALTERAELFPGVRVDPESIRLYIDGPLYAPILGYTGPITETELEKLRDAGYLADDDIGRTGIEMIYERYLRGTYGWREIERDAAQREIKTLALQQPIVGGTVTLTLDDRLQKLLDAELRKGVEEDRFTQAVGVAMNPQNGEILAMVSIPGYDNNLFARRAGRAQRRRPAPVGEQGGRGHLPGGLDLQDGDRAFGALRRHRESKHHHQRLGELVQRLGHDLLRLACARDAQLRDGLRALQ